jgi:hypothetical protein
MAYAVHKRQMVTGFANQVEDEEDWRKNALCTLQERTPPLGIRPAGQSFYTQ